MTETQKVLDWYGETLAKAIRNRLTAGGKNVTGDLVKSINYRYFFVNGSYNLQISGLKYLINVDRGRRAGARRPPIQPLVRWLKFKRGLLAKGARRPSTQKIESYAYAIATNISKRGIKAFPVLNVATKMTNTQKFKRDLSQAMAKDAAAAIKKQLKLI